MYSKLDQFNYKKIKKTKSSLFTVTNLILIFNLQDTKLDRIYYKH